MFKCQHCESTEDPEEDTLSILFEGYEYDLHICVCSECRKVIDERTWVDN
jgi:hypothetical protein